MRSSSESEGEIMESRESSKAIAAPSFAKDRKIDRRSYSTSTSADDAPKQSAESTNVKSRDVRRTDRSPSPYRHSRNEKRKRGDRQASTQRDAFDPRHHHDRRVRDYHDLDHPAPPSRGAQRNGFDYPSYGNERARDRNYGFPSRERERSRSPWRPGKGNDHNSNRGNGGDSRKLMNENIRPHTKDTKPRELNKLSTSAHNQSKERGEDRQTKRVKFDHAAKAVPEIISKINGADSAPEPEDAEPMQLSMPIDEDAEIERRRKERQAKREALLNKTKPSSLLTQALNLPTAGDSAPATPPIDTPSRESRQVTPITAPPTPRQDSAPNSPMQTLDLEKELERVRNEEADEPSAAMYDPSMDVDEDRARHEAERNRNAETPARAYDETKDEERKDVLIPKSEVKVSKEPKKSSGNMFADESDDDDDMFSEKVTKPDATKAVTIPQQGVVLAADLHDNWDTQDGFYKTIVGELIDNRYMVKAALGKGVFATVIRAQDQQANRLVAIKIVRNNEAMRKAGLKEIDILQKLAQADLDDHYHIVRLQRQFVHKNHLCMVFENLGNNLRDLVKNYGRKTGLEMQVVRSYAVQMFKALALMRKCEIIHADLKPDNILSDAAQGKKIKIADLGSATAASDNEITPYLASRFYRAPEVMLGIPPSYPIDVWAIGCTLFELYTDAILFVGKSNNEMLKTIQECRGKISKKIVRRGADAYKYAHFDANLDLFGSIERVGIPSKETVRWITFGSQPSSGKDLKTRLLRAAGKKGVTGSEKLKELEGFRDLLDKCLKLDPEERITPRQALAHEFCSGRPTTVEKKGIRH